MSPEEALSLKLIASKFAEATLALEFAIKQRPENIEKALNERDIVRDELYEMIDKLTED